MIMRYRCILVDPPWKQAMSGKYKKHQMSEGLPYETMTLDEIKALPVGLLAAEDCHLWLWTTNQFLRAGFECMEDWGFRYLAPVHWIKPSGVGNWFVHRTQTILFGYKERCRFPDGRYRKNIIEAGNPREHSTKPCESYEYIEDISPGPRLELFARRNRVGWDAWGDEVDSDVDIRGLIHEQ